MAKANAPLFLFLKKSLQYQKVIQDYVEWGEEYVGFVAKNY
jgi:hypothetical protein